MTYRAYTSAPVDQLFDIQREILRWQRIEAAAKSLLEKYRTQELDVPELTEPINDLVWAMSRGDRNG